MFFAGKKTERTEIRARIRSYGQDRQTGRQAYRQA
jgi:hypothetical protein